MDLGWAFKIIRDIRKERRGNRPGFWAWKK